MNYIWDAVLNAEDQNIDLMNIRFKPAINPSPYIELSLYDINLKEIDTAEFEINPLLRFSNVFEYLLNSNDENYPMLKKTTFDFLLHYFVKLDLRQGLCKSEYYIRFFLKDIINGSYGEKLSKDIDYFTNSEVRNLLFNILLLYKVGTSIALFRKVMKIIFPNSLVYSNNDTYREILIYIGKKENDDDRKKLDLLFLLFLDINYQKYVFWDHHFGIIDVDETLKFDDMMIF